MLLTRLISNAWSATGKLQDQLRKDTIDPHLEIEDSDAEAELNKRSSNKARIGNFLNIVRDSVREIHEQSKLENNKDEPDDSLGNIGWTLISDITMRNLRKTIHTLLSDHDTNETPRLI